MEDVNQILNQMLAVEIVLGGLFFLVFVVVCAFLCRFLYSVARWFDERSSKLRHDNALQQYSEND